MTILLLAAIFFASQETSAVSPAPPPSSPTVLAKLNQAFDLEKANRDSRQRYIYDFRARVLSIPPGGGALHDTNRTFEVTWINDHPYWRLKEIDDEPLNADEEKQQQKLYDKALAHHKDFGAVEQAERAHWKEFKDDANILDVLKPDYVVVEHPPERSGEDTWDFLEANPAQDSTVKTSCPWRYRIWISESDHQLKQFIIDAPTSHSTFCDGTRFEGSFTSIDGLPKPTRTASRFHTKEGGEWLYVSEHLYTNYRKFTTTITLHPGKEIPSAATPDAK